MWPLTQAMILGKWLFPPVETVRAPGPGDGAASLPRSQEAHNKCPLFNLENEVQHSVLKNIY